MSELESLINYVVILNEGQILYNKNFDYKQENLEQLYYGQIEEAKQEDGEKELFFNEIMIIFI
ncbi:hypothetical protein E7Y35_05395 [Spiroplasma sp. SV19]|nr:hypothetical protein E7Y35_05395 [Spiroplasma sp. SV19]